MDEEQESTESAEEIFSQDENFTYMKTMLPLNSQEFLQCCLCYAKYLKLMKAQKIELKYGIRYWMGDIMISSESKATCSIFHDGVKKEISVPLSPPMSPNSFIQPIDDPQMQLNYQIHHKSYVEPIPSPPEPLIPKIGFVAKSGRYIFQLNFEEEKKPPAKSCNFTYSKKLHKLFAQSEVPVHISMSTKVDLPSEYEIRTYCVYDNPRYQGEVVEQCPVHLKEKTGLAHQGQIIRCANSRTRYEQCPVTNRFVCIIPYSSKQSNRCIRETFKLSCLMSCRGGINRRPLSIYFALFVKGVCQGQAKLPVHCCASPGRDRKNQEAKEHQKENPSSTEEASTSRKRPCPDPSPEEPNPENKKPIKISWIAEDNGWYNVKVRGLENAKKLAAISEALNLSESYWCSLRGVGTSTPYKNGLLLTNKGYSDINKHLSTKISDNQAKFENLCRKYNVRSTALERSQSDPTSGFTSKQRLMQLQLPHSFFEKAE